MQGQKNRVFRYELNENNKILYLSIREVTKILLTVDTSRTMNIFGHLFFKRDLQHRSSLCRNKNVWKHSNVDQYPIKGHHKTFSDYFFHEDIKPYPKEIITTKDTISPNKEGINLIQIFTLATLITIWKTELKTSLV